MPAKRKTRTVGQVAHETFVLRQDLNDLRRQLELLRSTKPDLRQLMTTVLKVDQILKGLWIKANDLKAAINALTEQRDELRAHNARLREALAEYGEHSCILSRFEGGRPTAGGGYEMRYAGKWYETRPVDRTPVCECGLAQALAEPPAVALDALKREVAERVREACANAAAHERAGGSVCCQTEEIIRALDLSALLAEARHERAEQAPECSICRRRHGPEVRHECE